MVLMLTRDPPRPVGHFLAAADEILPVMTPISSLIWAGSASGREASSSLRQTNPSPPPAYDGQSGNPHASRRDRKKQKARAFGLVLY